MQQGRPACVVALVGFVFANLGVGDRAAEAMVSAVDIQADHIEFYANPGVLSATGGVTIHLGESVVRSDSAAIVVPKQELIASGDVTVADQTGTQTGATYVYPLDKAAGTFVDSATMPALPRGVLPTVRSTHASYLPNVSIRFAPADVSVSGQVRSQPSYVYQFGAPQSAPQTFSMSALPPASIDVPIVLTRSSNFATDAHVQYDQFYGFGYGVEEKLVQSDQTYAAFSMINYSSGTQFNLLANDQLRPGLTTSLVASDMAGMSYARYDMNDTGKSGTLDFSMLQSEGYQADELDSYTRSFSIAGVLQVRGELGMTRELHPVDVPTLNQDWYGSYGLLVSSEPVHAPFGSTLTASWNLLDSKYDYNRFRSYSDLSFNVSRQATRHVELNGSVDFTQFNDSLFSSSFIYPDYGHPLLLPNGGAYYGPAAYTGTSTQRTYQMTAQYDPSQAFGTTVGLAYAHDFPQYYMFGRPQYTASFDLRIRVMRTHVVEIGDSIPFGGLGQRYPGFLFFQITH
jgi:hypothetical protein